MLSGAVVVLLALTLTLMTCGGVTALLLRRGGSDPAIEARFDAWCQ